MGRAYRVIDETPSESSHTDRLCEVQDLMPYHSKLGFLVHPGASARTRSCQAYTSNYDMIRLLLVHS